MKSLRELYRIGIGPSSSHTMGPACAAALFRQEAASAVRYRVELYGSLAATGRGHMTDRAVLSVLDPERTEVLWKPEVVPSFHPNGLRMTAYDADGGVLLSRDYYSVGGGAVSVEGRSVEGAEAYPFADMSEVLRRCETDGVPIWQLAEACEGAEIWPFLDEVLSVMDAAIERGLVSEGALPGGLHLPRRARSTYLKARLQTAEISRTGLLVAYAQAVAEENAALGRIVTAPTCGSCGVMPSVLRYMREVHGYSRRELLQALATAGIVGNVVKANGSISGAEVGCQGEIGVACAMASAAVAYLLGGTPRQCETAAEIGLEHFLGLTCDPVMGLVQVPCIERNAIAATRAIVAGEMAILSDGQHMVSFDTVVKTMVQTGHDLPSLYRETAEGGLSAFVDCSRTVEGKK